MPYYFMRDTPLQALEQLMMSQPGQKPRGGGIYRSPFHYTPKDVACEYCQNYVRKHPCRLCECTCLDERIEAGVLELNEFVRDCFAPSMGPQFRKRMHQQLRERNPQFFLSNAHRRRWTYWRERCWRLSDRNKAALFLLTAYESLWRRMVWKCGNDGFDFQSVRLGGIEPELYSVYQAAKAIAIGCCNITLADLASPELVTDESFHLITGALLMAKYYAMTATEAALYDQKVNGNLRSKMGSLTHKNLPLAIFLEEADLGYPAWSGSTNSKVSNDQIISSLGIGVVRFNGELEPPDVNDFDYEYRVDTDVISSVEVSGGQSDPDNPVTVHFVIQGRTYTVSNVYYPDGDSQLVWVKWHTPSEPCVITIAVSVSGGGTAQSMITCNIVDLDGNDPPNPVADDRNDRFRLVSIPEKEHVTSASWGIWSPWWQENWEWVENWEKCWHTDRWVDDNNVVHRDRWYHWVDNGWWEDHGWWEFDYNGYSASLTASMRITPDEKSPTATASTLKSGYGVQEKVTAKVTTNQSAAVTAAQNAVTYFPEFGYESYWRLLEADISGRSTTFQFKANPYSTYNRRTHFTPIWYPDGSYTPYTWLLDCWTPAGMLSMNLTSSVTIRGNLWEEWHIAPAKQR